MSRETCDAYRKGPVSDRIGSLYVHRSYLRHGVKRACLVVIGAPVLTCQHQLKQPALIAVCLTFPVSMITSTILVAVLCE